MEDIVYCNGALLPRSQAKISVSDYGYLYGYGLFETMRAYDGVVFRLDNHIDRLAVSASTLRITIGEAELKQAVVSTLDANKLESARIRVTVSAGEGSMVPDIGSCKNPTVLVTTAEYTPYPEEMYMKGFRLMTSRIRRNSQSPVPAMKTLNYLECLLARQEAKAAGYDDALLLNESGCLAETAVSNIFLVSQGTIFTPDEASGILHGITRAAVIEIAGKLGMSIEIHPIRVEEIPEADEVFLTNSLMEIMPVTNLDDRPVGNGHPGEVTNLLRCAYKEMVERETG